MTQTKAIPGIDEILSAIPELKVKQKTARMLLAATIYESYVSKGLNVTDAE